MGVVLMYHGVGDEPAPHSEPRYTVSETKFATQLDLLLQARATVLSLEACLSQGDGGGKAGVVLTFDDGEASVVHRALPLMAARSMAGTVYVTTDWIGQPGYASADELRGLRAAGWTVGAHSMSHRYLSGLGDQELDLELTGSRQALVELLGEPVVHMSLPGGRAEPRVMEAARRAGYDSVATSAPGRWTAGTSTLDLPRLTVLADTSSKTFEGLIRGHLPTYLKIMGRAVALDGAKYVLGDRRYDRLRGGVLRFFRGL